MRNQLSSEDQVQLLELENKALRFQAERQTQMIDDLKAAAANAEELKKEIATLKDDLRVMDRYRMLVERASIIARDIPGVKDALVNRSLIKKQGDFVQVQLPPVFPECSTVTVPKT